MAYGDSRCARSCQHRVTRKCRQSSSDANLLYKFSAQESENKLRAEHKQNFKSLEMKFGFSTEYDRYYNNSFIKFSNPFTSSGVDTSIYTSNITLLKYGAFIQTAFSTANKKLSVSLGARFDGNTYNKKMANPLAQFSPRASLSIALPNSWSINANSGVYYQLPPYTTLGYRDNNNVLVNKA